MVPVIHTVGTPKTATVKSGAIVHHSLGDGDLSVFHHTYSHITVASTILTVSSAARDIDRIIIESMRNRRPGYIGIPTDIIYTEIPTPTDLLDYSIPKYSPETQSAALQAIEHA